MNAVWLYPLILAAGALQAWGPADKRRVAQCAHQSLARQCDLFPSVPVLAFLTGRLCVPAPAAADNRWG